VIGIVSAFTYSGTATFHGKLKVTLDHISNGTFLPHVQRLLWVPEGAWFVPSCVCAGPDTPFSAGDGVFATMGDGTIELVDLKSNSTTVLVKLADIKDVGVQDSWQGALR